MSFSMFAKYFFILILKFAIAMLLATLIFAALWAVAYLLGARHLIWSVPISAASFCFFSCIIKFVDKIVWPVSLDDYILKNVV